jgi:ribosomal protein S18 acetylase RimI-like enzyme
MDFIIQLGILTEHKEDAARLYAIAFQTKFKKILGSPEEVTQLLKDGINIQRGISAISEDNELLGISGFHLNNTSLIDIKFKTFISKYGIIKGTFKYIVLVAIFSRKPDKKSQLLMDGIAVKEGNRGHGIGKQLFIALEKFSIQNKMNSIKLDVVDENPKAKKLYDRIGFVPIKYRKMPNFISELIGVGGVTTMVKEL